jgi:DNA-binding NtrC family response regulator
MKIHPQDYELTLPETPSLKILCVDDEVNILKTLKRLFYGEPFQVLTATSGRDGLAILQTTDNIGLILSDQRMPEMSGSEFLEAAMALAPHIPRIILTGYADVQANNDAMSRGGAIRVLTKPWKGDELLLAVREVLQLHQQD